MTAAVVIYTTGFCGYCSRARTLFEQKGVAYEEIRVDSDPERRKEMMHLSGRRSVPQIFVGDHHIGGCDDLYALDRAGKLDPLINEGSN
ncbi:MAG: glutaredoxin 3 [Gammaproteobacteria bacterium]